MADNTSSKLLITSKLAGLNGHVVVMSVWRGRYRRGRCRRFIPQGSTEKGIVFLPIPSDASHIQVTESVDIYPEELEVLKKIYVEGLTVDQAALALGLSNATLWRILDSSRRKIVDALLTLKPIKIVLYSESKQDHSEDKT